MKKLKLTKSELATMQILWDSEKPLSIKDIPLTNPTLNPNTVAVAIKNLLKKGAVQVADITYHGAALTRLFEPAITKEQYFMANMASDNIPIFDIISNFLKTECTKSELEALEKIIEEQKDKSE